MEKFEDYTNHSSDSFSDAIPFESTQETKIFSENKIQDINDIQWINKWAEIMNGEVVVTNEQDGKTVFTVTIPSNVDLKTNSFIERVNNVLKKNFDNEDFGISELCRSIGLSRSQLHNKLKAKTGLSTSHFIRTFRLKKALPLLQDSDLNISEIAYKVGFKNPSYFSRLFTNLYGLSPCRLRSTYQSN